MTSLSAVKELHDQFLDATIVMDTYTAKDSAFFDNVITLILPYFTKIFTSGDVKGEMLINLCYGPYFEWTFPACEYFTDFILGASTDKCIAEIEKWRKNEPGALDWSHVAKALCELQGNGEDWPERQNMLKRKVKQVVKYDVCKSNPLSPTVLPQADCLLLTHCVEAHVTNKEEFCSAISNVSSLLKNGGHLILIGCLKQTFYKIGSFKFPHLSMDESFVREALGGCHYVLQELQVFPRTLYCLYDVADYESFIVVHARKELPV